MRRFIIGVFFTGIISSWIVNAEEAIKDKTILTLPKIEWILDINVPGLIINYKALDQDGNNANFQAVDANTGITISAFLEEHSETATAKECRDFYWAKAKESPFRKDDIVQSDLGEMAIIEYIVKVFKGETVNQKNMNAYLTKDNYWIDVHLSKINYTDGQRKYFEAILKNIKIKDKRETDKIRTSYKISQGRKLLLDIPADWQDQIRQREGGPSDITITAPKELDSKLMITVTRKETDQFKSPYDIKNFVESVGNDSLPQSIEGRLDIKELKGNYGIGYYFTLTDKAPKPDEYKYMTQGVYRVKNLILMFTVLTNQKESEVLKTTFDIIASSDEQVVRGL